MLCGRRKINFYRLGFKDGLCFVPVNDALKLIIAWLSDVWKKNEVKIIKPPAVRERIQNASGPYVKAC